MSTISCHLFFCCHLSLLSQCSVIMVTHYPLLFFWCCCCSSPQYWLASAFTLSCLLPTHDVSYLMVSVHCLFLCMSFDFCFPFTNCWLSICSQTPLDKNLVDSLLTLVLLSRDFKSFCLISHGPDFSFVGRCPLVIQSAVIRAEGTQYTTLKRM